MIQQGHIDAREAIVLLWFMLGAKVLLNAPATLVKAGFTSGWMIALAGAVTAAIALLPGLFLMRRFDGLPFARVVEKAGGLVIGKIVGLILFLYLFGLLALTLREFSGAIGTSILPTTPVEVLIFGFLIVTVFTVYLGLESIGRFSLLLAPWLLLFFVVIVLGEARLFDVNHFFPLWGPGPGKLSLLMLQGCSRYFEVIILWIMYPYLRSRGQAGSIAVRALALAALIITTVQIVLLMTLDVQNVMVLTYPIVSLARLVTLGTFVTRIEALLILLWVFVALVSFSVVLWACATTLGETLRLPGYRVLLPPLTAILFGTAVVIKGAGQAISLDTLVYRQNGWIIGFVLPLVIWLLAVIRRKKGGGGQSASESDQGTTAGAG